MSTVITAAAGVIGPPTCGFGPSIIGHSALSPARRAGPVGIAVRSGQGAGAAGVITEPPK
jgi:hypothetical protein